MGFRRFRMISFRVSETEYGALAGKAARKGLSLSDLIRSELRQADLSRGVVDVTAYGTPSRTLASGGSVSLRDGQFAYEKAA
jgi:hypothetical protein